MMRNDRQWTTDEIKNSQTQTASSGPVGLYSIPITWRSHLTTLFFLISFAIFALAVTTINLSILYAANPGYGRDLAMERAFCAEINETFTSSHYVFDEIKLNCVDPCSGIEKENSGQDYYWHETWQTCLPMGMEVKR